MASTDSVSFTHDMVVVHRLFRRELGQAPNLVRGVAAGDLAQAGRVHQAIETACATLHNHHEGEDVVLWPRLRDRAPQHGDLLDVMESQHAGIDPLLESVGALGAAWASDPGPATAEPYAAALQQLHDGLIAHLDQEERDLLPIIAEHIDPTEWSELAKHVVMNTPPQDLQYLVGSILEDATDSERAALLKNMPPPLVQQWQAQGRTQYVATVTAARGTAPTTL